MTWEVGQEVVVWPSYRMNRPKRTKIARVLKTRVDTEDGRQWKINGDEYGVLPQFEFLAPLALTAAGSPPGLSRVILTI